MPRFLYILFAIVLSTLKIFAAQDISQFSFEQFQYPEKLPSNSVIRIFQDSDGYMWFGTKDGLCRFDSYDVKVFRSSALTPGKLTSNEIRCIEEDNYHNLWVGTFEGINLIDKRNYTIKPVDNQYLRKDLINSILNDSKGYIWVATSNSGVLKINPQDGSFERYSTDKDSHFKLAGNNATHIFEDKKGNIWISLWKNGLCYINSNRDKLINAPKIGNSNNPFRFFQDKDNVFWVCTWGDGIFNLKLENANKITIEPIKVSKNSTGKLDDIVYSIAQDQTYGFIWVVTFSGLNLIQKDLDGTYKVLETNSFFNESTNKLFHEIKADKKGNIWVGSVGEGLFKLDFNKLAIQNYPLTEIKNLLNIRSYVTRFCELSDSELYIAINRVGLFEYDMTNKEVRRPTDKILRGLSSITGILQIPEKNEIWISNEGENKIHVFRIDKNKDLSHINSIPVYVKGTPRENNITCLFSDSRKNIWIGSGNGLFVKSPDSELKLISSKIYSVNTINEDSEHNIWVGTEKEGVFVVKPAVKDNKINYSLSKIDLSINNYQSISVQSICCKKNGEVYMGTKEGCLYYYNSKVKIANDISGQYGITDEGILDIVEGDFGMLWISTIKRIIRYNPESHVSTYFSTVDGMLVSSFFKDACIKLKSGKILFGGNNGFCSFDPAAQNLLAKPRKQHVVITDILMQNKSIFNNELNSHYNYKKNKATFSYSQNNINLEFSALDFSAASKIQYAYMLSDIDKNWNYVSNNRRFVNYANLPDGKYRFLVKSSDENGLWSDQITTLDITILPPFYRTWWAYLIYIIILGALTYFFSRIIINRIRLRNELRISHIEKEKSEELAQIKLRYFTNISHELLTPLTIIMLLIDSLQKKTKGEIVQLDMMKANVNRLKRLIQQILVFRKTESGNMKLKISENDIIAFVHNICHSNFQPLVIEKSIKFSVDVEYENYMAYFDPDKLDKIIYNLLSNAFKHTPREGAITVKMQFTTTNDLTLLRLSVIDTGDGIAEQDLPHIFNRFYISSTSDQSQSHGIGLALTHDLLQIHKGNISVSSQIGKGTNFTFEIPISKNSYTEEELYKEDTENEIEKLTDSFENGDEDISIELKSDTEQKSQKTILVVEDNIELKNLIVENFKSNYQVLSAENGNIALKLIQDNEIDLVISDVMMPEMDGLTLCKIIKNDISTSHINVLMLTAKNSTEDRIDCYNAGADGYIAKPFELSILDARTSNLLSKRDLKTENFQKNHEINISSLEYNSIDEQFLNQAIKAVEDKLADDRFDFDQFAEDMATSKSTLHRKLKSLTGLSPGEFIRNIRLKHAVLMLTKNTGNISEIAFAVGFNDPKYFSRCFKIEYGQTPREYQESHKDD